jgi:uncharacterized membrane protein YidH (DUF202 family)
MKNIGMILIGIGIVTLLYSGFTYTTREKVVDLGPIEINKDKKHSINWPPITGIALLISGILVLVVDKRK